MIVSTTLCYPNPAAPTQGIFVQRRLREFARLMPTTVVAPVPWCPLLTRRKFDLKAVADHDPPVHYARMPYVPGVLKRLDAMFYERALSRKLAGLGVASKLTAIDAHFEWPDGVGAFRVARRLGVPFVCTLRGKLVSQMKVAAHRAQIAEMLRGADALIAVSRSLAELACTVAGRWLDIAVIPNGIDKTEFHRFDDALDPAKASPTARAALGWKPDAKYVVSVAHLQPLKGFDRLARIWPSVVQALGPVHLVLVGGSVGDRAFERRLGRLARHERVAPHVALLGRQDAASIARLLNAADLFVLASSSEGSSNAIREALACGCPVVASDVGGNGELVAGPELGRLVTPADPAAWAAAICEALRRDWDRDAIARAGSQRDWQQVARECADVFIRIVKYSHRAERRRD